MPERLPHHPKDITAEWLTSHLKRGGGLSAGSVTSVTVQMGDKWNYAHTARVTLEYDEEANHTAPRRLFVKIAGIVDLLALHLGILVCRLPPRALAKSGSADIPGADG